MLRLTSRAGLVAAALALITSACGGDPGQASTTTPATTAATTAPTTVPSTTTTVGTTTAPTTTTTTAPVVEAFVSPYSFEGQHPGSPVLVPGDWDVAFTAVPHVIAQEDGTWLMFYSGDGGRRVPSAAGLATSADGISWQKHEANPIFERADGQAVGWLFVIEDGDVWRMLYTTGFSVGYRDAWFATAPSPEGPWTEERQAFVAPGGECCQRFLPTGFTKIGDTYWVPFAGFESGRANPTIGFYTSTDLVEWTATETPVHAGSPGGWDEFGVVPTNIIETDNGLEVFFLGFDRVPGINLDPSFTTFKLGRLISQDGGQTWRVDNDGQPVLDTGEKGWPGVSAVYEDSVYWFFMGDDLGGSGIALVTGTIP